MYLAIGLLWALALVPVAEADEAQDRGRVVYASDGSIFVSSGDTHLRWRLTRSESDFAPAWSPDGSKVAFLRAEDDGVDLYVVSSTGGTETRLAENVDLTFDWAPDGKQIVFSSTGADLLPQNAHLFVVGVESGVTEQLTDAQRSDLSPQWSPDGRSIVFVGSPPPMLGERSEPDSDIYRLDVTSGRVELLTQHRDPDYGPQWSPDGTRIAFTSTRVAARASSEPAPEIYVMDASGHHETRLTFRRNAHDLAPRWSPEGRWIAFLEYKGDAEESGGRLRMMRADGSHDRVLTDGDKLMAWDPSWSPNGETVVFVASRIRDNGDKTDTELAYVEVMSGTTVRLTDNDRFEWGPDWR
jgi:Tol biopolymer transport system component